MTLDEIAANFLGNYASGTEAAEGWLFARALQQCRLDYTPESLSRLDDLLRQARERAKPSAEQLAGIRGRNFTALVAFYLIEMLRRGTGAHLEWHDRAAALRTLPTGTPIPERSFTRMLVIGKDQGAAFWPLSWVEGQLLPEGQRATAAEYIADLVRMMERDAPVAWWPAAEAAGRMASWQMAWAQRGGPVTPTMLGSRTPAAWQVLASGQVPDPGVRKTLDDARRLLEANPDGAAWQVLGYDGFVEEQDARMDAIIVVVTTYGDKPLRMKLAFPYRPATADRPFAILQTRLRDANAPADKLAKLQDALERGIQAVEWPAGASWNQLRT
jgi:hypothetical protein